MWAITSFFNPVGYRRRLVNYRRFHAALSVPLAAIELGFNGRWELTEQDADILVQVGDGDVMWQKERLLNVVLKHLPPECEYVAWIDSDVLFQDPQWPQRAVEHLGAVPLVQLFSELHHLEPDGNRATTSAPGRPSIAGGVLEGHAPFTVMFESQGINQAGVRSAHGMAWVAHRDLLECHGFYDCCVIGGGDTALSSAAYGVPGDLMGRWQMNAEQRDYYSRWATGFHADVKGEVGVLPGEIHTLWHGDPEDRGYALRQSYLVRHHFDPNTDIRLGADGAWRWASDKPALHAAVTDYFQSRREDGKTAE